MNNSIIKILIFICVAAAIFLSYQRVYGAAHLIVNMCSVEEEVLTVSNLFPKIIFAKFEVTNQNKLLYESRKGVFIGVKLIRQVGTERTELTNLIITDTTIDLKTYGLKENTTYELCIKPYYDFEELGILNVSYMSEYNFNNYIIKTSKVLPPKSLTLIFEKGE